MRRRNKVILLILLVLFSVTLSLVLTNKSYFQKLFAGSSKSYLYSVGEGVDLVNWREEDGIYYSGVDSQIIIRNAPGEISEIIIDAEIDAETLETMIYYIPFDEENFSEKYREDISLKKENNQYILTVNLKNIKQVRIDLNETDDLVMRFNHITIKEGAFKLDKLLFLVSIVLACFATVLFTTPISHYKMLPQYLKQFDKYSFLLSNLVKKDFAVKYRRSVLGVLWSVLNPLLLMLVLTAVFQNLFKIQIENFPIYYLTGSLIFNFNAEATNGSMVSIINSSNLIKKVYIPKYIFPLEKCLFSLLNMLFSLIALVAMFVILQIVPPITTLLFPIPIFYTLIFSYGLGMILATLNVFFRDISHLYSVWIVAWTYLTPLMYPESILPKNILSIVQLNPLYYYVGYFRKIIYEGTIPDLRYNLICLFFSFSFLLAGFIIFKKNQDKFILYV